MDLALAAIVKKLENDAERLAEVGCGHVDTLRRVGLRPDGLEAAQDPLRRKMVWVESEMRELRAQRRARLTAKAQSGLQASPRGSGSAAERDLARRRVELLELQRSILRQLADGYAWIVLREDPRVIFPLYAPQTHQLPEKLGLAAPAEIAARGHKAGTLLCVENDLTRCLGIGDLTVVFADRPWRHPLVIEVKASGQWKKGAMAEFGIVTAHSDYPEDVALYDEVCRILGEPTVPTRVHRLERKQQIDRLVERTELLLQVSGAAGDSMPGPSSRVWSALERVAQRAVEDGLSYDLVEPGMAFVVIRADRPDAEERARDARKGLEFMGFGTGHRSATSLDLQVNDAWAGLVPPISLWPVSRRIRVLLLTRDLYFMTVVAPDVWEQAFAAEDLKMQEDGKGGWVVRGRGREMGLDVVEVQKLVLGVAFSGISPRDIAGKIAAALGKKMKPAQ